MTIPGPRNYDNNRSEQPKSNKNGYEIRTDILVQARGIMEFEFTEKLKLWEATKEGVRPSIPSLTDVVAAANKLYEFVNNR